MLKTQLLIFPLLALTLLSSLHGGEWKTLFDGKSLTGWKGLDFWSVKDGTIFGETTKEHSSSKNTFLILQNEVVTDFEFICQVKFSGNNSGVMYRSKVINEEQFTMGGYQADLHSKPEYFGMLYGERFAKRGIIAQRGQRLIAKADGTKEITHTIGDDEKLTDSDWNELRIVAVGNRILHFVNGQITMDLTEHHPEAFAEGMIGLQLHAGLPMWTHFKDLKLRHLEGDQAKAVLAEAIAASDKTAKPIKQ